MPEMPALRRQSKVISVSCFLTSERQANLLGEGSLSKVLRSTQGMLGMAMHGYNISATWDLVGREWGIPETYWPAWPAKSVSSRLREHSCFRK